ncbi:LysR family transcriptional regulator [Ruegeria faecimaris]|uniref:DNA-binding transcriptional regulator, LysR family n=1 Tax=Ruegeria faecimaris TaxID=686389 RepID=A0A521DTP1_9RHOB|nr:LysR family transcriptional regulator [Ruegeria faecimaris]SMO74210.1 DNA-binding transcriptional regulator, LysR family [Ruegeria faecimaris]
MAIKIETLRSFCTVVQTGNLTEAADRLGRTQSAVSMTLKQLEEHLGKKLFEGERKNRLSEVGRQVHDLALKQVRQFDQTVQDIEAIASAEYGLLRIVSVPSVAALAFPKVLSHMNSHFPDIRIELRDTDTQQVLDAVVQGKADIGIASGYLALNGVTATPLFEDRFGVVCTAAHPLAQQSEMPTIEQVASVPFIRNALCDLVQSPRFHAAISKAGVTIQNTHSLIALVRTEEWVTVLPQTVARSLPEAIVFRPIADLEDQRQVYLYVSQRSRFQTLTDAFGDFILKQDLVLGSED